MTDTNDTPIELKDNPAANRYDAEIDGEVAFALYEKGDGTITFIHTVVPETLRGRGIAGQIVVQALADVRRRGLRVTPRCPVFAAYMKRHADVQDLVTPEGRTMLGLAP